MHPFILCVDMTIECVGVSLNHNTLPGMHVSLSVGIPGPQ